MISPDEDGSRQWLVNIDINDGSDRILAETNIEEYIMKKMADHYYNAYWKFIDEKIVKDLKAMYPSKGVKK